MRPVLLAALAVSLGACSRAEDPTRHLPPGNGGAGDTAGPSDSGPDGDSGGTDTDSGPPADTGEGTSSPCPEESVLVETVCMDRYEAPNQEGAHPLVMYTFEEAAAWCAARDRRLCTDAEWERACAGAAGTAYPYGNTHDPGRCNDEETWRTYSQSKLNGWPSDASATDIESLEDLYAAASTSASGATAADHVASLYQGEGSGENTGCKGEYEVYDLVGNVEEWTRRADGGRTSFHGNLKGRYWAESRTCQSNVTTHGDTFRFYEIGFRCCSDLQDPQQPPPVHPPVSQPARPGSSR